MSQPLQQDSLGIDPAAHALAEMPITRHLMVLRQHLFKIMAVLIGLFFVYCRLPIKPISCCLNRCGHSCRCTLP